MTLTVNRRTANSEDVVSVLKLPASTEVYTLSLHDALPISRRPLPSPGAACRCIARSPRARLRPRQSRKASTRDRKSTRLNSSHEWISYAVFCLKKKNRVGTDVIYHAAQGQPTVTSPWWLP